MPLDGLRAWIGEVERKLGMRTRVFLVLATIAIGGAGAAIYLAIDTREDAVSESDVQALQERLESRPGTGSVAGQANLAQLEAELNALEAKVERLNGNGGAGKGDAGDGSDGASSGAGGAGAGLGSAGAGGGNAGTGTGSASTDAEDAVAAGQAKLQELVEQAPKGSVKPEEAE